MLKVEGIAFRFLPDPLQIKNALDVGIYGFFVMLYYFHLRHPWNYITRFLSSMIIF